jgi:transposase
MTTHATLRENDAQLLQNRIAGLSTDIQLRDEKIRQLQIENDKLKSEVEYYLEQFKLAQHQRFAKSSEKIPQQELLFNEAETAITESVETDTPAKGVVEENVTSAIDQQRPKRQPIPDRYPRVDIVYDLPENEKVCPHDGTALNLIGEDVSEQLDIIPAKVQVLRYRRKKYACPCCDKGLATATMPPQPIPKSIASPNVLAIITTGKYVDAVPLYRQAKAYEQRLGVDLPRNTMASWMVIVGRELLASLVECLRKCLVAQPYLHMDETRT